MALDTGLNRTSIKVPLLRTREWLLVSLLLVFTSALYLPRLTTLTVRGEESRRARGAVEMLESGDWIVPRQQGLPYLSRPPLAYWLIAFASKLTGAVDPAAIRLPSVLAIVLTTALIYIYARSVLPPWGAFSAAVVYATMGQVLELGRTGENEAPFTLFVSAALLLWHLAYMRSWQRTPTWILGYACAALAALTKGPQGLLYFVGPVWLYVIVRRDWAMLISKAHAAGIAVFTLVVGAWQILFLLDLGWQEVSAVWLGEARIRFREHTAYSVLMHLLLYPWEVLGSTLPWSLLLLAFGITAVRHAGAAAHPHVVFLTLCILVTFPTCWLAPGARPRHFMSLYPVIAVLVGMAIQRCSEAKLPALPARLWRGFQDTAGMLMSAAALGVLGGSLSSSWSPRWAQPIVFAWVYALITLALAATVWWTRQQPARAPVAVLAVGAFMGLTCVGVVVNTLRRESVDTAGTVARLRAWLPGDEPLASLGAIHHLFAYHWRDPIAQLEGPARSGLPDGAYFCIDREPGAGVQLPFAWEEIAVVSVGRSRRRPSTEVIVGRRVPVTPHARATAEGG